MTDRRHETPPRVAAWMLGWLLSDVWETRLGDYEESYNERAAAEGTRAARWWYRGQVLRLIPDRLYEKSYWGTVMFKNYLLLGFRNLRQEKVASSINLVGLSAAVACAVALFLLLQEINTHDDFHENGDRIFLVGHTVARDGGPERWGTAPSPLGPTLAADFPQVERAVRFAEHPALVQTEGGTFHETVSFADAGFFEMFTFPLHYGRGTALSDPNAVILSAEMAVKYFGTDDPMGQTLVVTLAPATADQSLPEPGVRKTLTVAGVAAPFPPRADFQFGILVGYENRHAAGVTDLDDWATSTDATFIQLRRSEEAGPLAEQLDRYLPVQNAADERWQAQSFFLDSIQHPDWLTAWQIEDRALQAPLLWESLMFGLIALLILLVACFNYITISLGAAARRLKEIGIRKTVGAHRAELVKQFLTENLLLCFLAVLGGLVMAWTITIPFLNSLLHRPNPLDIVNLLDFWPLLVGLLLFLGLVSGSYPAFYISAFQPTVILRDRLRLGEKKGLTRTLTVVQFTLALITICLSIFTASLDDQLLGGDWGYDQTDLLVIATASPDHYDWLQREAARLPQVNQMAGAAQPIGSASKPVPVRIDGVEQQAFYFGVGPEYLHTLGIEATVGRGFSTAFSADSVRSVMVNQTFAAQNNWTDPVGESVEIDGRSFSVVGVAEDFLLAPMAGKAQPVVFGLVDAAQYRSLTLRVANGTSDAVANTLQARWEDAFPDIAFASYPQADAFARESMNGVSRFITYLALFALFISCMGLFGLASQGAAKRVKEIGVRKALGASPVQIVLLVNRGFLVMLGLAALIATPLCYLGLRAMLYAAPVELSLGAAPFVLSNALVFVLAAATLSLQTSKLVKVRPAEVLRCQ